MSAEESAAPSGGSSKYDLTRTISKYLDLHMMFPLLDFVVEAGMYPSDQVAQARLDLVDATNMVSQRCTFVYCTGRCVLSSPIRYIHVTSLLKIIH